MVDFGDQLVAPAQSRPETISSAPRLHALRNHCRRTTADLGGAQLRVRSARRDRTLGCRDICRPHLTDPRGRRAVCLQDAPAVARRFRLVASPPVDRRHPRRRYPRNDDGGSAAARGGVDVRLFSGRDYRLLAHSRSVWRARPAAAIADGRPHGRRRPDCRGRCPCAILLRPMSELLCRASASFAQEALIKLGLAMPLGAGGGGADWNC